MVPLARSSLQQVDHLKKTAFPKALMPSEGVPTDRGERRGQSMVDVKSDKRSGECYNCEGRGHYAFMCPTRKQCHNLYCEENPPKDGAKQHPPVPNLAIDLRKR
jgi:hypothetical protein